MGDTTTFIRQVEAMYERLGKLYSTANSSQMSETMLLPIAFKELGVAAEELQVATEELHQQNEQMVLSLSETSKKYHYYNALFDLAPQALLVTTLEGKIQEANQLAARLLDVPQSLLIGKLLVTFIPQTYRLPFRSQLNRLSQSNRVHTWSTYVQVQSSELIHLILSTAVVHHRDGMPTIHWTLQDSGRLQAALVELQSERSASKLDAQPLNLVNLPNGATNGASASLDRRPRHVYLKGETIPLKPQTVWQVLEGLVKLSTLTESSEEILLGLVGPSMPFTAGSTSLLTYQAIAMSDVQLISIPIVEINASSSLAQQLLPKFHRRLGQTESLLNVAGQRPVKNRLYHLLKLLKQEIGQPIEGGVRLSVRLTHEDIANACCTTRVTVTRLLGDFQRQGKIAFDQRYHILLKEEL